MPWTPPQGNCSGGSSPPCKVPGLITVADGVGYVAMSSVLALDAATGDVVWQFQGEGTLQLSQSRMEWCTQGLGCTP